MKASNYCINVDIVLRKFFILAYISFNTVNFR